MKNRIIIVCVLLLLLIMGGMNVKAQKQSAYEIMQKVDNREDGDNKCSVLKMILVNKRGRKRIRTMKMCSMDIGKDKKSIMYFQSPADVKNTSFLTWDYDDLDKDDDRWLYLPAMKKVRRISGASAKKDYFMGSDFTYDDMGGNRSVDEDVHTFVKEELLEAKEHWVIDSKPIDKKDMYSKRRLWIRKECLIATRIEYYDKMGKLLKTFKTTDIEKIVGIWTVKRMHMLNHQKRHETILEINNVEYNLKNINKSIFVVANLEKRR